MYEELGFNQDENEMSDKPMSNPREWLKNVPEGYDYLLNKINNYLEQD